jgi:hypothetical protein
LPHRPPGLSLEPARTRGGPDPSEEKARGEIILFTIAKTCYTNI